MQNGIILRKTDTVFVKHSITLLWGRISKNGPYLKAVEVTYNAADLSKAGETEINMVNTMLTYGDSVAAYLDASGCNHT